MDQIKLLANSFLRKVFQVPAKGTPLCMVRLDSQTLHIRYQIILKKIKQIRKTLDKEDDNICKKALIEVQYTCGGGDLLTECKEWCKKLNIRCVTKGTDPIPERARLDEFKLKQGLWKENDKDIKLVKDEKPKVKNIAMPTKKIERNYLAKLTTANARIWFRYRSQIIDDIKGNKSSLWTGRMQCRHCNTGEPETQEHIEGCSHFAKERATLNLEEGKDKLIFWRRVIFVLKCMKLHNKDLFDHRIGAMDSSTAATSEDLAEGQVYTYLVSDKETCIRGREVLGPQPVRPLVHGTLVSGRRSWTTHCSKMLHTGY